ncbi:NHLP bacteriocin export ABC transporter permease/ATPase subunit [Desulfolutivibrio sulfoxidireducens]|uniref:NHLP bacteriocin export ABC transporter permease/ATPase subunit n=1 Tax=Desulfolutivibrio sulfoxidireducens TaxID=2773299 RepID=UPI00159E9B4F|nr:NHLP bacteriocin export ABC transporter permease/ATPase subunit [Desulfolutivibrio sulfoxidireducens]QLA19101.1 NHLP bacteriocin export ABC transporter permease/ATPase subunit [Desulfolutivibrio sulfoxidireducens]
MSSLFTQLAGNAPTQSVSGKTPFRLDDPDSVWLVVKGHLDVFAVPLARGELRGPREHLFSADSEDVLVGHSSPAGDRGQVLLAVGVPGTEVARISARDFLDACAGSSEAAKALTRLVLRLGQGVSRRIHNKPRATLALDPGRDMEVDLGDVLRPAEGVVFVRLVRTGALFCGMEETGPDTGFTPLSPDTWLACSGPGRAEAADLAAVAGQGLLPIVLRAHLDVVLACLDLDARVTAVDVFNVIKQKSQVDRRVTRGALDLLARSLKKEDPRDHPVSEGSPLVAACELVARSLGVPAPAGRHVGEPEPADVPRAAESLGLRARPVTLRGQWWRDDSGPFVGFFDDGSPVALIARRPGRYQAMHPASGESRPVTRELAARIGQKAWSFIRPFPDRPLCGRDLVRQGLHGCGRDAVTLVAGSVLMGLLGMAVPVVTGLVFSEIIPGANRSLLAQMAMLLASCALAGLLIEVARNIALQRFVALVDLNLEPALWDRLLRLPTSFFRLEAPGALAERAEGLWFIRNSLAGSVFTGLFSSIFAFANLALLFYYDASLARVALLLLVLGAAGSLGINLYVRRFWRAYHAARCTLSGLVIQLLSGIAKLKLSGSEPRAFALWAEHKSKTLGAARQGYFWSDMLCVFELVFPLLATIVLFAAAFEEQNEGAASAGTFLAFLSAFGLVQGAMIQLTRAATDINRVIPVYKRLSPILEATPESSGKGEDPGQLAGGIEIVGLTFRYIPDGPVILDDIHLRVEPGQFVALAGPSGSGKSTLLRLLLGFERPESGSIYYDDLDLADFDLTAFRRRNIGAVLQNGALLPGDIFSNISGSRDITLDQAWAAARGAGLAQDIEDMPLGMRTPVSAGMGTLSGGQRQRLLIARALAGKPRILFFDEATSALDNRSQETVSASLTAMNITRVVVAHRLSTIQNADRIFFLEDGRIVESGTHAELLARGGRYVAMARRQMTD